MIHIEQGQVIPENENLIVSTLTGDYEDGALIEFFDAENRNLIIGSFQAQFIRYGGIVYKFNSPKELGEEILKIDPESTHTAASYVRMSNELLFQMEGGSLESNSLNQALSDEQTNMDEKMSTTEDTTVSNQTDQTDINNDTATDNSSISTDNSTDTTTTTTTTTTITTDNTQQTDITSTDNSSTDTNISNEETPVITPEVPTSTITLPTVDQPVSKLKSKRKIA